MAFTTRNRSVPFLPLRDHIRGRRVMDVTSHVLGPSCWGRGCGSSLGTPAFSGHDARPLHYLHVDKRIEELLNDPDILPYLMASTEPIASLSYDQNQRETGP